MNLQVRRRLREVEDWIDARAPRERALVLVAALAVLGGIWTLLLMDPLARAGAELDEEAQRIQKQIRELTAQGEAIIETGARDPNAELRDRGESLKRQIAVLEQRIQERTVSMISPAEMSRLLEKMLLEDSDLRLVRLENLGSEALLDGEETSDASAEEHVGVYKHSFEVVLEGRYLSTLRYLSALEALPWNFFWETLAFEVQDHPDGRATIRAYTLSAEEGWVGA